MKYKTFRALVVGSALVTLVGGGYALSGSCGDDPEEPRAPAPRRATPAARRPSPPPTTPKSPGALRAMDGQLLALIDRGIQGSKQKDAFPRSSWKANLYRDAGHPGVNRVKIDLDRDERWDEKWTIEGAGADRTLTREVSRHDDERYDEEYALQENAFAKRWDRKGAAAEPAVTPSPVQPTVTPRAAAPTAAPASAAARPDDTALRPLDRQVLERLNQAIRTDKVKDAFPAETWKLNLYRDAGNFFVNRLKIDLDRDERWDEKWTIDRSSGDREVKRQVSPTDNDQTYPVEYQLGDGQWEPVRAPEPAAPAMPVKPVVTAPPAPTPTPEPVGDPLRAMDQKILARVARGMASSKEKDALKGESFKVNLYRDAGHAAVNRLKIDLDRDDKDDEKWTFERDGEREEIKRQVSPTDDGQTYSEEYRLRHGRWVRKTE